jgi:aspartyl-tRNA(Asn)/glutamyl-tRNA(Gln) amidotransferase subunit C
VISIEDVEHVAKLARLALTQEEKEIYAKQLGRIIENFNELKEVDTSNVEPLAHPLPVFNVMREDEIVTPPGRELLLKTAPAEENGYFRVPKIGDS